MHKPYFIYGVPILLAFGYIYIPTFPPLQATSTTLMELDSVMPVSPEAAFYSFHKPTREFFFREKKDTWLLCPPPVRTPLGYWVEYTVDTTGCLNRRVGQLHFRLNSTGGCALNILRQLPGSSHVNPCQGDWLCMHRHSFTRIFCYSVSDLMFICQLRRPQKLHSNWRRSGYCRGPRCRRANPNVLADRIAWNSGIGQMPYTTIVGWQPQRAIIHYKTEELVHGCW